MTSKMSREEFDLAIGAHGLEKAPWYSEPLMLRIIAELQRQIDTRPDGVLGETLLNVTTPSMTEAWLEAVTPEIGPVMVDRLRAYGSSEHGLVWPGSRARMAASLPPGDREASRILLRTSTPGTVFLVVRYGEPSDPRVVMMELPYSGLNGRHGHLPS